MTISIVEIMQWIGSFFWPFVRISAMMSVAPFFSSRSFPLRIKLFAAVAITLACMSAVPVLPMVDVFTWHGLLVSVQQVGIGVAIGLIFLVVFQAFVMAGQIVAMGMGLAFSNMVDPASGAQSPVLSQYYSLMVTALFIVLDGHLLLIHVVVDSFATLPLGVNFLSDEALLAIAKFGLHVFSGGMAVALPLITALLMVNISLGVITKAAPQLNIFAIGFAITLMLGFIFMSWTTPQILPHFQQQLDQAFGLADQLQLSKAQ